MEDAENDSIIVKEKKLVDKFLIKSGMLRFSFLLECAPPGAIPDPQLVAAMLELVGSDLLPIAFSNKKELFFFSIPQIY